MIDSQDFVQSRASLVQLAAAAIPRVVRRDKARRWCNSPLRQAPELSGEPKRISGATRRCGKSPSCQAS